MVAVLVLRRKHECAVAVLTRETRPTDRPRSKNCSLVWTGSVFSLITETDDTLEFPGFQPLVYVVSEHFRVRVCQVPIGFITSNYQIVFPLHSIEVT